MKALRNGKVFSGKIAEILLKKKLATPVEETKKKGRKSKENGTK